MPFQNAGVPRLPAPEARSAHWEVHRMKPRSDDLLSIILISAGRSPAGARAQTLSDVFKRAKFLTGVTLTTPAQL